MRGRSHLPRTWATARPGVLDGPLPGSPVVNVFILCLGRVYTCTPWERARVSVNTFQGSLSLASSVSVVFLASCVSLGLPSPRPPGLQGPPVARGQREAVTAGLCPVLLDQLRLLGSGPSCCCHCGMVWGRGEWQ